MRLVKAAKASPHAEFYNLSTDHNGTVLKLENASWSSGNAFVSGAGGLRFQPRAGQIGHSIVNGSPLLQHFFKRSCADRAQ